MVSYRTKYWQHLRTRSVSVHQPEFNRFLRKTARPAQIAFAQIMRKHGGNPSGIEFRHHKTDRWAFVMPEVSAGTGWRIQYFSLDSFSSHHCFESLEEAVETMCREGFTVEDAGVLDALTPTVRWQQGILANDLVRQVNAGQISWETANQHWLTSMRRSDGGHAVTAA